VVLSISRHRNQTAEVTTSPGIEKRANDIRKASTPLEGGVNAVSGVLRFENLSDLEDYVRAMLMVYRQEYEKASDFIGSSFRATGERPPVRLSAESWDMVGPLFVNSKAFERGQMDVAMQLLNDLKPRISKTEEVVDGFNVLETLQIPLTSSFLLYMRNGTPERLIVDPNAEPKDDRYSFSERYELN
jgi:hypothetical protein